MLSNCVHAWLTWYVLILAKFLKGMPIKEILNVKLKQIKKKMLFSEKKNIIDNNFLQPYPKFILLETLDAPFLMILHSFDFIKYRRPH